MQFSSSLLSLALAMSAAVQAAPMAAAHGHNGPAHRHHHAKRVNYNLENVNWDSIDWAAVFGQKKPDAAPAAGTTTTVAVATAQTVAAAVAPVVQPQTTTTKAPAAATTTPAAAAPATPAPVSSSSGGKRGIAWEPANGATGNTLFSGGATSWVHNWGMSASFDLSGKQYVYTIRTLAELGQLGSLPRGAQVLGFNEADIEGISPEQAASIYKNQLAPLRNSGAIGLLYSPSITNGGSGLPWLKAFMAACNGACAIDQLNVHWYGPTMAMLTDQLGAIHSAFPSYKVAISEIAATNWNTATNPSPAQIAEFLQQSMSYLDGQDWVSRYAWFKGGYIADANLGQANSLMESSLGSLTALGKAYNA